MKAQASVEFLVVVAVIGVALLPILLSMHWDAQTSPEKLMLAKAQFSASRIAMAVNSVGSLGPGGALITSVDMPSTTYVSATGREITIRVRTTYGYADIVQPTRFNLTSSGLGNISREGVYVFDIKSGDDVDQYNVSVRLR